VNQIEDRLQAYARSLDAAAASTAIQERAPGVHGSDRVPHDTKRRRFIAGVVAIVVLGVAGGLIVSNWSPREHTVSVNGATARSTEARLTECSRTHFSATSENPDVLPNVAYITKAYVSDVGRDSRKDIMRRYHAQSIGIAAIHGHAWLRSASGAAQVVSRLIYVLNVQLESRAMCPDAPAAYNGVPLIFLAPPASA
jgi:hypothetical protein